MGQEVIMIDKEVSLVAFGQLVCSRLFHSVCACLRAMLWSVLRVLALYYISV